ncbi:MAG: hypothetical protein QGF21_04455 [Vicinamibacterales bacterium]|nr:hypothetical protein [Acidobacteriota bacterium]MDP7338295.1 hypothetical protein [Vicinamibacterales bacterium]MDP7472054.1 hypothetical protein [Vicinamibacterales bacterium]MDP7671182.1 hypothetical protein [Vicinamibacterales bacterium]HJO38462.1 hypothetical protein [Vicinamibacterales bacterium]
MMRPVTVAAALLLFLGACAQPEPEPTPATPEPSVADDVLFTVLGKMSLHDQSADGEISLRDHHFVTEIMPKAGRTIVVGTLTSANRPDEVLEFAAEGNAFLAHGERVMEPAALHVAHPDGTYIFSYETQSGSMERQPLTLTKRSTIEGMLEAARVTLRQDGEAVSPSRIDPDADLNVAWTSMAGNARVATSELGDLIFIPAFDCFGNNVAHSGRPFQGGPYLTYEDTEYVIAADALKPGLNYSVIVEQATADTERHEGVPGIATYATLTFVDLSTMGEAPDGEACPAN